MRTDIFITMHMPTNTFIIKHMATDIFIIKHMPSDNMYTTGYSVYNNLLMKYNNFFNTNCAKFLLIVFFGYLTESGLKQKIIRFHECS